MTSTLRRYNKRTRDIGDKRRKGSDQRKSKEYVSLYSASAWKSTIPAINVKPTAREEAPAVAGVIGAGA